MPSDFKLNVNEAEREFAYHSGEASKINRQLAFTGIAIIWIFRSEAGGIQNIQYGLVMPLFCFVISLIFDVLYSLANTTHLNIVLIIASRKKLSPKKRVNYPGSKGTWIYNIIYYLKYLPMAIGYFCLLIYLADRFL
jgi:hypothetical protein